MNFSVFPYKYGKKEVAWCRGTIRLSPKSPRREPSRTRTL